MQAELKQMENFSHLSISCITDEGQTAEETIDYYQSKNKKSMNRPEEALKR